MTGMHPSIHIAAAREIDTVLALIEALLAELGQEGQEFARIDLDKLQRGLERATAPAVAPGPGRFLALLARDESGASVGVLTLSTSFAIYAGGEYGVIDEMYVKPEYRSRGIGRSLVEAAVDMVRQREWFRLRCDGAGRGGRRLGRTGSRRPGAPFLPAPGVRAHRPEAPAAGLSRRLPMLAVQWPLPYFEPEVSVFVVIESYVGPERR